MKKQNSETEIVNEVTSETLKNEPFESQNIGECNYRSSWGMFEIYDQLTGRLLPALQSELAESIGTEITKEELVAYLADPNRRQWIQKRYIEVNNLQHGGMDVYRMFDLNLIPGPETEKAAAIAKRADELFEKIKEVGNFYYPIIQLWDEDFKGGGWYTPDHFQEALEDFFTRKTQTPEQNQILEIFERLCSVLNELVKIRIIRPEHGPAELTMLNQYIKVNDWFKTPGPKTTLFDGKAFTVDPYLFRTHRLQSFYDRKLALSEKSVYSNKNNLFQLSV